LVLFSRKEQIFSCPTKKKQKDFYSWRCVQRRARWIDDGFLKARGVNDGMTPEE
jgi:hypothetical protein